MKNVGSSGRRNLSPHVGLGPPSSSTLVEYTWQLLSPLMELHDDDDGEGKVVMVMKGLRR